MASRRPSEDANNELTNVGITLGKVIGGGSFAKVSAAKQVINGQEHKRAVKSKSSLAIHTVVTRFQ